MDIEKRIREIAFELFSSLKEEKPSFFDKSGWKGKVVEWSLRDEAFKVQLLRFIDVLPALKRDELALRVFREYLDETANTPSFLGQGAEAFARMPAWIAAPLIRTSVRSLARQFIAGADPKDAWASLDALRKEGAALSVDLLGEAVVSDAEALRYAERYGELLDFLAPRFPALENTRTNRGRLDVSLKVSSFYSQMEPLNREGSIKKTTRALLPVLEKAQELGVSITFDMEQYYFKDLIIAIFKNVLSGTRNFPLAGIALQAYLRDTREDVMALVDWAKENGRRITIRLVKGAYWDHETVVNRQKGWPVPVFLNKEETDRNYEALTEILLKNAEFVHPAIATHNIRSISNALAVAGELSLSPDDFEFQALYGMADPVRRALKKMSVQNPVRVYCPVGELIPGMAYLVRRILENTSNESFFRKSFAEEVPFEELMRPPKPPSKKEEALREDFRNEAVVDFSRPENRGKIKEALDDIKKEFGREYPLFLGEQEVFTEKKTLSINPARPGEVIGRVSSASKEEAEKAVEEAKKAQRLWGKTSADERAKHLFRAAAE
ncbi:MAG TPA: proline dehydrogenase family protein, partial [Nitrospirota bacterium]